MKTKITLSIEKKVLESAKAYSSKNGQTLSNIIENYFRFISKSSRQIQTRQFSPRIQKLQGIINAEEDFDFKEGLAEELIKQYELGVTANLKSEKDQTSIEH